LLQLHGSFGQLYSVHDLLPSVFVLGFGGTSESPLYSVCYLIFFIYGL
jgi:hypothetical protein